MTRPINISFYNCKQELSFFTAPTQRISNKHRIIWFIKLRIKALKIIISKSNHNVDFHQHVSVFAGLAANRDSQHFVSKHTKTKLKLQKRHCSAGSRNKQRRSPFCKRQKIKQWKLKIHAFVSKHSFFLKKNQISYVNNNNYEWC